MTQHLLFQLWGPDPCWPKLRDKKDIKSAFRLIPEATTDFELLGFKFQNKYYFDKMLPFGAAISCAVWEKFATSLHWIIQSKSRNPSILNYLDDVLFAGCQILVYVNSHLTRLNISVAKSVYLLHKARALSQTQPLFS